MAAKQKKLGRHGLLQKWAPLSAKAEPCVRDVNYLFDQLDCFMAQGEIAKGQPRIEGLGLVGFMATMIKISIRAGKIGLPLKESDIITTGGGQVVGSGANVPGVVRDFGISRFQSSESGRTSRATVGYAKDYMAFLNDLHARIGSYDLSIVLLYWIRAVRRYLEREPIQVKLNRKASIGTNIDAILHAAKDREKNFAGETIVGTVLQHLVGAALELSGSPVLHSHSNKADIQYARNGDFDFDAVVWHVTSAPSEGLIRKCAQNIKDGLSPLILTIDSKVQAAVGLLEIQNLDERVQVLAAQQFFSGYLSIETTKEVSEQVNIEDLINKYNELIETYEKDLSRRIEVS
jgi:hypothetical protein